MKDKVAIVTGRPLSILHLYEDDINNAGANSPNGIGRAAAHQYAHNGALAVYICDFADNHLPTHKREIEALYPGVDVHVRQFDAADEEAVKGVVGDALGRYGRLDVFFANAGVVGQAKLFTEVGGDEFMGTLRVNVLGYPSPTSIYGDGGMVLTRAESS